MKLSFCIILAVLPGSFAAEVEECPSIPPAGNFNYQKWAESPWRVVNVDTKDEFEFYRNQKCITDTYNPLDGKVVTGVSKYLSTDAGKQVATPYHGVVDENPAVMTFSYTGANLPYATDTFRVIATDNSTYSVNLSCGQNKPGHPPKRYVTVAVYFRGPGKLPAEILDKGKLLLQNHGIDVTFKNLDWTDCSEPVQ